MSNLQIWIPAYENSHYYVNGIPGSETEEN